MWHDWNLYIGFGAGIIVCIISLVAAVLIPFCLMPPEEERFSDYD